VISDSQRPESGGARTASDFVKSAGRFSLAMGLLSVRQATRLLSGQRAQTAAAFDEVSDVASRQLTGVTRSAFAVGTNLQHGLVDAAIGVSRVSPRGQSTSGSATGLKMSLRKSASRRLTGVRTVASGALRRPVPQAELIRRLANYQTEIVAGGLAREQTVTGLWKSEGLATTIAKHRLPQNSWNDPALPRSVLPVVHVGFGSGATSHHLFDAAALNAVFADTCANDYREFAYEGIGAILRAYESGFFKFMAGALGLMRLDTPDGPNPADFFADYLKRFPPHIQRIIAHGYGRIFAFSHMDIYDAIRDATRLPQERVEPVAHGAGFAFAMMNSADLPHILRHSAVPFDPAVRAAFQNGLIYGLVFMEWYMPGVLANWKPESVLESEMIEHARRENMLDLKRGYPLVARLENPRT
jgi:hypothetical protein